LLQHPLSRCRAHDAQPCPRRSLRAGAAADNVAQAAAVRRQRVLTARPLLCGTLEALRAAVGVL